MLPYIWNYLPQSKYDLAILVTIFTTACILARIYQRKLSSVLRQRSHASDAFNNAKELPGPFSWPVVGNCFQISGDLHLTLDSWSKQYGPVFKIKLGNTPAVVLNSLDSIKEALIQNRDAFSGRPEFSSNDVVSLGHSIVFHDRTNMSDWYKRKELVLKRVSSFVVSTTDRAIFEGHIKQDATFISKTLTRYCATSESGYIDPARVVEAAAGNAMSAFCFGKRFDINDERFTQLLSVNREFGEVVGLGNRIDVMPWIKIFPQYRRASEAFIALSHRINNWVLDKVKSRISSFEPGDHENLTDSLLSETWNEKLRSTAANGHTANSQHKFDFNLEEFTALLIDVVGAGQDTVANAMLFVFHYMIKYPDVAKRARDELDRVVGPNKDPCLHDRGELVYLRAVIHEVLRHSSISGTGLPHRTLVDSVVQGYKIPANYMVLLNFYTTNNDPTIWERPKDFDPTRFLRTTSHGDQELDVAKTRKYLTFSTGARKCPGNELATYWLTLGTAILLKKYELEADPENPPTVPINYGVTLRPASFKMKLVPRELHSNGNHCHVNSNTA